MVERQAENTPQRTIFVHQILPEYPGPATKHVVCGATSTLNSSSPHQDLPSLKEELKYLHKVRALQLTD